MECHEDQITFFFLR